MAVSKVILNSTTLMDATTATAAASDITSPKTAMLANGVMTTGTGSGGGSVKSLTNILGSSTTFVMGYLASDNTIANQSGTNKEITTDYFDISSYAGATLRPWVETGGNTPPWVGLFFYDSSYNTIGSRQTPVDNASWGNKLSGVEYYGNNLGSVSAGATITVPSSAVYIRVSFRTGGNAAFCLTDDSTFCTDFFDRTVSAVAFVNPLESDGTAA